MALYLVSYDILGKNDDYQSLWDELDSLNAVRILYSEWATPFEGTGLQLVNLLVKHVEKGDSLFACELFGGEGPLAWLKLRISDDEFRKLLKDHARRLT